MKEKMMKKIVLLMVIVNIFVISGCGSSEDREAKYLSKAQSYFDEENYDKVRVELKNVLQINPKNAEARYLFALVAEKDQDWRKMYGNLLAAIEENPDHIKAQLKLGKLFLFSKDAEKASEKAELVLTKDPQNSDALALKATILLTQDKKPAARVLIEQVLAADPGHIDSALLMIRFLGTEKKMAEAMQVIEKAIAVNPDVIKLSLVKINILMVEGKKAEAEQFYLSLVERFPENQNLYFNLAKFYVVEKKPDEAEQLLKKLIDKLPDEDQPKLAYIDFLIAQRGEEQAEQELSRIIKENSENFTFRFARLKLNKDDPVAIKKILEDIVADDPLGASGIDARNRLAVLAMSKEQTEEARKLVEEVVEIDPRNIKSLLLRAGFLIKDEDYNGAIADVRTILRDEPDSEKALMLLAIAQLRNGNNDLAQEALEKVLMVNSKNLPASKDLARMMVKKKDEDGALKLLERSHEFFKDDLEVSVMLIDLYGKRQNWKKAENIAQYLAKNSQKKEVGHYKLAQIFLGQKNHQGAVEEFKKVLAIKPLAIDALSGLINSYMILGQAAEAESYLDGRLAKDKDNIALLTLRGELHKQQNQLSKAEKIFKQVIDLKPKFGPGYQKLASVYLMQKSVDKAINSFQQGINESPKNVSLIMKLATLLTAAQKNTEAIDAYNKILALTPGNKLAANNLAALLVSEEQSSENLKQAQSLIAPLKESKHSAFLDTFGWVSFLNGNVDDALVALEAASKKKDSTPEMHYHLAMVYLEKGDAVKAKRHLKKAIDTKQNYVGIDKARKAMEELNAPVAAES